MYLKIITVALLGAISLLACNGGNSTASIAKDSNSKEAKTIQNLKSSASVDQYPKYIPVSSTLTSSQQAELEARYLHSLVNGRNGIPKSYGDTEQYWKYLIKNNTKYQNYRLSSDKGNCLADLGNDATIERVLTNNGLDVYDGAVWEIALSLEAKNSETYADDIKNFQNFIMHGISGGFASYRAYDATTPQNWLYNGVQMPNASKAYILKFVSPSWSNNFDPINGCNMNWPSYEGVTGEQAWLAFIGAVQTAYNVFDGSSNPNWSNNSTARGYISVAEDSLDAIIAMQDTTTGGVYRNVQVNGQVRPDAKSISLENNFSLFAGLSMLEKAIEAQETLTHAKLKSGSNNKVLLKGQLTQEQTDLEKTKQIKAGLIRFFTNEGIFDKTGGYYYTAHDTAATGPKNSAGFVTNDFAVDVQTWGATTIVTNPDLLSAVTTAFGADAPYKMLKAAIDKGAYRDADGKLLGVGYTSQTSADSYYEMSGEWTIGAINAAIVLASHYQNDPAKKAQLIEWAKDMIAGIKTQTTDQNGVYGSKSSTLSVLYANKREMIPFGWWSNKVPSTASTAWDLMLNTCYDPMELGGGNYKAICEEVGIK